MRVNTGSILAAGLLFVVMASYALAEGITKEQGEAILQELKSIRQELEEIKKKQLTAPGGRPAQPTTGQSATLGNPILGDLNAPVTLVEFTGYQCPFCRRWYNDTFKKLKKEYIDTGKLRFVLRDLPLPFHKDAKPAARAAHCAGEQDKFWDMHNALFEGKGLNNEQLMTYAGSIGIKSEPFKACLDSDRYHKDIDQDVADAGKTSIQGTPGFVVGKTTDNMIQGPLIVGAQPYDSFKAQIDQLLAAGPKAAKK